MIMYDVTMFQNLTSENENQMKIKNQTSLTHYLLIYLKLNQENSSTSTCNVVSL